MKSPEEYAAEVVRVKESDTKTFWSVYVGKRRIGNYATEEGAKEDADYYRSLIVGLIDSAVVERLDAGMPQTPLTEGEVEEIRRRAEAATEGPWHAGKAAEGMHRPLCDGSCENVWAEPGVDVTAPCGGLSGKDADFVAAARTDIPRLLVDRAHLQSIIRDVANESLWQAGYQAGRREIEELRGLLREIEWSAVDMYSAHSPPACPACHQTKDRGHTSDCRLAAALGTSG